MNRNNKIIPILIILIVSGSFMMTGWGRKTVELLDENLIDLDKAVKISIAGVTATNEAEAADTEKKEDGKKDSISRNGKDNTEKIHRITIQIHGKEILYNGKKYDTADDLVNELSSSMSGVISMQLKDDYAEAHKYREADEALRSYCEKRGYEYTAD